MSSPHPRSMSEPPSPSTAADWAPALNNADRTPLDDLMARMRERERASAASMSRRDQRCCKSGARPDHAATRHLSRRGYARECVLLARFADSVELRDQLIQLLRMMESSSEPRSRRKFQHL